MAVFNSAVFYSGVYFTDSADAVKTGTGGIDPGEGIRRIVKPTGLVDRPIKEGRKDVEDRVDESAQIEAEIAGRLAKEFVGESQDISARQKQQQAQDQEAERLANEMLAIDAMTQAEIDLEIGLRLRKKLAMQKEEDELIAILTILGHVV